MISSERYTDFNWRNIQGEEEQLIALHTVTVPKLVKFRDASFQEIWLKTPWYQIILCCIKEWKVLLPRTFSGNVDFCNLHPWKLQAVTKIVMTRQLSTLWHWYYVGTNAEVAALFTLEQTGNLAKIGMDLMWFNVLYMCIYELKQK